MTDKPANTDRLPAFSSSSVDLALPKEPVKPEDVPAWVQTRAGSELDELIRIVRFAPGQPTGFLHSEYAAAGLLWRWALKWAPELALTSAQEAVSRQTEQLRMAVELFRTAAERYRCASYDMAKDARHEIQMMAARDVLDSVLASLLEGGIPQQKDT